MQWKVNNTTTRKNWKKIVIFITKDCYDSHETVRTKRSMLLWGNVNEMILICFSAKMRMWAIPWCFLVYSQNCRLKENPRWNARFSSFFLNDIDSKFRMFKRNVSMTRNTTLTTACSSTIELIFPVNSLPEFTIFFLIELRDNREPTGILIEKNWRRDALQTFSKEIVRSWKSISQQTCACPPDTRAIQVTCAGGKAIFPHGRQLRNNLLRLKAHLVGSISREILVSQPVSGISPTIIAVECIHRRFISA